MTAISAAHCRSLTKNFHLLIHLESKYAKEVASAMRRGCSKILDSLAYNTVTMEDNSLTKKSHYGQEQCHLLVVSQSQLNKLIIIMHMGVLYDEC